MARELLLRLALRNYERAREVAAQVAERAQKTLATAKGLTAELRQGAERAEKLAAARERASARGAQYAAPTTLRQTLGSLGQARERGEQVGRAVGHLGDAAQSLPGLMTTAGWLTGLGAFTALLVPLTQKLIAYLDERLEKEIRKETAAFRARLEEERFLADYPRRLREEPAFARAEARKALEATLMEEALLGKRLEKTRGDLVADFGL